MRPTTAQTVIIPSIPYHKVRLQGSRPLVADPPIRRVPLRAAQLTATTAQRSMRRPRAGTAICVVMAPKSLRTHRSALYATTTGVDIASWPEGR